MELPDRYVMAVYEEMSFTAAAKKLYISQPALSAALARHEKALGFAIFNRKNSPIRLTTKGRIYIESLLQIISVEASRDLRIREVSEQQACELTIGCSNILLSSMLTEILAAFYRKYPRFTVKIDQGHVGTYFNLHQKLENGKIDYFLNAVKPDFDCSATLLKEEEYLIAVPNKLAIPAGLRNFALTYGELFIDGNMEKRVDDVKLFHEIPFMQLGHSPRGIGKKMRELIGDCKTIPIYTANGRNPVLQHYMAQAGISAAFTVFGAAKQVFSPRDDISYFLLADKSAKQKLYLFGNPLYPQTAAMKAFMETALEVCADADER